MAKKIRNNINQDVWLTKNDIVKVPRTKFYRNFDSKLTFNPGKLVPLFVDEILPGQSYDMNINSVVRFASPLIRPVMDDVEMEMWAFFVPSRLLDDDFESIIANYQKNPDYSRDVQGSLSTLTVPDRGFGVQSVGDYFGLPTDLPERVNPETKEPLYGERARISLLPFRGYTFIWDTFFRDENLQNSIFVEGTGHQDLEGYDGSEKDDYVRGALRGGRLCPLNKKHDLFTSALPAPQKGAAPTINVGGEAPIKGSINRQIINFTNGNFSTDRLAQLVLEYDDSNNYVLRMPIFGDSRSREQGYYSHGHGSFTAHELNGFTSASVEPGNAYTTYLTVPEIKPSGLFADLGQATGISVNDLRALVQVQRLKEQDARYGSRYPEYLLGSWGVVSADSRLQLPEFLGKVSFNLNVNQTVQTSGTNADSPQSNVSAYSLTGNVKHILSKSFTEHGYLFVVGGVRIKNRTYSQNINKMWSKLTRYDFYNPVFANLGEQGIKNQEIFYTNERIEKEDLGNNGVFGYQEAWYEYRYLPNQAKGYMRPGVSNSLAVWNYAENYETCPTLSPEWIKEDTAPINRTLAVPESTACVFIADLFFKNTTISPMPLHSIPGLLDHSGKVII